MVPSFTVVPRFDLRRKGFGPLAVADGNKKGNHHARDGSLFLCTGGAEGTRTPDPLHAMQVRYQLRHSPVLLFFPAEFPGAT